MVGRTSPKREQLQVEMGRNLQLWRRVNGMSASQLADRAAITRETLRSIETGSGAARLDSFFAVLTALGIADSIVRATDPYSSNAARARIDAIVRQGGSL